MTSNLSLDQIHLSLDEANDRDENIRITRPTSTVVQFLDVSVENNRGRLRTMVDDKLAAERYFVLFLSDYPRQMHRNVIKTCLTATKNGWKLSWCYHWLVILLDSFPIISSDSSKRRVLPMENHIRDWSNNQRDEKIHDQQRRPEYNKKKIQLYFTFEIWPKWELKNELRRLWRRHCIYPSSPMGNVTLKIGTQSRRSLHQLLVKK